MTEMRKLEKSRNSGVTENVPSQVEFCQAGRKTTEDEQIFVCYFDVAEVEIRQAVDVGDLEDGLGMVFQMRMAKVQRRQQREKSQDVERLDRLAYQSQSNE